MYRVLSRGFCKVEISLKSVQMCGVTLLISFDTWVGFSCFSKTYLLLIPLI